jgi:tetratricopeptide (TPR) repeat protein
MADVFLSYARASADGARRIAEALSRAGYSVWFDENLPAHRAYSEVIEEQLEASKSVLVLWSEEATKSHWVRSEANRARETGRLVQVRLDEARLPMPFDQIQCADLRGWRGDVGARSWKSVVTGIDVLVSQHASGERGEGRAEHASRPQMQRRQLLLAGGTVIAAAAVGLVGWKALEKPKMSPQSQLLLERGLAALQDNDALDPHGPGSTLQAITLLSDATEAAPHSATAWGGLAMAYGVRKRVAPISERPGLELRCRSAARRALRLDPNEVRALGALRMIEPVYRNWLNAERADRLALESNPKLPILLFIMSDMLGSVGRWKEAAEISRRFDRRKFLIPGADRKVVINLWASGDLQGADSALQNAVLRWPQHPQIWRTHLSYLMYSGRPGEVLELLKEDAERPLDVTQDYLEAARATAEGLMGTRPASAAIAQDLDYLERTPTAAMSVVQACAALGALESALDVCNGYYFGEGKWSGVAPAGGDEDRVTIPLFQPPMQKLWRDERFDALLERIGLNGYWRKSGTVPDFRRGA